MPDILIISISVITIENGYRNGRYVSARAHLFIVNSLSWKAATLANEHSNRRYHFSEGGHFGSTNVINISLKKMAISILRQFG